jgi:hypothetical protein
VTVGPRTARIGALAQELVMRFPARLVPALLALAATLVLASCSDPMLTTGLVFTPDGVSVKPTLSGRLGDGTVYIQP